jgi:Xaa-Pro dipeptidase
MNNIYKQRLNRLEHLLKEAQVDLLAIVPGANLRYLTGLEMHPSERISMALLPTMEQPLLLVPELEAARAQASIQVQPTLYTYTDQEGPGRAFERVASKLQLEAKTIAVEHLRMRVLELRQLERCGSGCQFVDGEPLLSRLRIVKDDAEIEAMRRASEVNGKAFQKLVAHIRHRETERALAAAWQKAALDAEGDELPDIPIVASGPNAASPHTEAGSRPLQEGDLVIVDGFLRSQGYYSDITRTYAVGEVDKELARVYSVVQEANAVAREIIKPGVTAEQVDAAARGVIENAGYGQYFVHRTGHGLGLEIHEPPYIVEGNKLALQPGMTFTVEPGIYLPGRGGVRIEDDVLVTEDGCETLTTLPRELMQL